MNYSVVIVLPTYNERDNIGNIIEAIQQQRDKIKPHTISILVVDDSSPDGTATIVKNYSRKYNNIHLLSGEKNGLGAAYIRGFKYAIRKMHADIIFEMDADFSHNPNDIPHLLAAIDEGNDFVIGSRYVPGGSIPQDWSFLRKLNSKWGNIFARHVAGIRNVKDCTGGFRAIRTSLLEKIQLNELKVKGYAFQISLLNQAVKNHAKIVEVPIQFKDRVLGESKISMKDITEFVQAAFFLRFPYWSHIKYFLSWCIFLITIFSVFLYLQTLNFQEHLILGITIISLTMVLQALFTWWWMLYAWDNPNRFKKNKSPKKYAKPKLSFTAIVPARHEERVIGHTITALSKTNYPEHLKEIIIVCRNDDEKTINKVNETIKKIGKENIKLALFDDLPINKPHALNIGLQKAMKNIVVVFDAEDEPHKNIFSIANTVMSQGHVDVLQSGVQLMNYRSTWFSTLNVLEYFFWFKSTLQFFAEVGIIPLGGNTVFFKKSIIKKAGGWDENCLTEDADIGFRLSALGAKIKIVYDEKYVTQEETPLSLSSFIKQRTRWNQGFIQIFSKGQWLQLPKGSQRFLAGYILFSPQLQTLLFAYLPISLGVIMFFKLPIWIVILSTLPLYILILQYISSCIALYLFTRDYKISYPFWMPLKVLFTYMPFQIVLGYSATRALIRILSKNYAWEKTHHSNAHRIPALKVTA